MLDSGTGKDIGGKTVDGEDVPEHELRDVDTAKGITRPIAERRVPMPELCETSSVTILENCPRSLEIGRRCAVLGFDYHWRPYASEPKFTRPDGVRVEVDVDADYVASMFITGPSSSGGRSTKALPAGSSERCEPEHQWVVSEAGLPGAQSSSPAGDAPSVQTGAAIAVHARPGETS